MTEIIIAKQIEQILASVHPSKSPAEIAKTITWRLGGCAADIEAAIRDVNTTSPSLKRMTAKEKKEFIGQLARILMSFMCVRQKQGLAAVPTPPNNPQAGGLAAGTEPKIVPPALPKKPVGGLAAGTNPNAPLVFSV